MGIWAAQKGDMHQARQLDVVDIFAAAFHQPARIRARHAAPDIGVRQILDRQRHFLRHTHDEPPAIVRAASSIASTIDW